MPFVNTLPYISTPIEEFRTFRFVSWERDIYPAFKGRPQPTEHRFFADIIRDRGCNRILDLGAGGGTDLSGILDTLSASGYRLAAAEANEVNQDFIDQARRLFSRKRQRILIHRGNWVDLPAASPPYPGPFDFAFLIGNSLTYIGGGTREYTKNAQQSIIAKFAGLIPKGGHLFIDSRNYDYIRSLMHLPKGEIFASFTFDEKIYYHGEMLVFPAYISDTVVVLHYYDLRRKVWSKLDLYPIYQKDMETMLRRHFRIEVVYHDFQKGHKKRSQFVQWLVRKK